ncbi:MAG: MBOAT family protein [Kofleriaceae bacterium]
MQFNTYLFAAFFAGVLAVHYAPLPWTLRKVVLLVASYVFYAAWDPPFVALLFGSTAVDWFVAKHMAASTAPRRRKALLVTSLAFNLGLLGYFKYAGFFHLASEPLIVPIGISFYTFITLSYTIDVYLGRGRPARSFLDYALYVTFFPHLVAGPIVRAHELVPQFERPRRATGPMFAWGLALLVLGLFQKIVVADGLLAPAVDAAYSAAPSTAGAWAGTIAFAGQIFCDFSGYSTCAIGVALCLGFSLPDNFRFPYAAVGFSDFWRRWHVSLSSWLRDYLYVPLGGSRRGALRTHANLLVTMLVGGLWHGAAWTFVVWGGLHGIYLVGERILVRVVPAWRFWRAPLVRFALALVTFALVCVAWVFFRAESFPQAFDMCRAMFGAGTGKTNAFVLFGVVPVAILVLVHWAMRDTTLEAVVERTSWPVRTALLSAMLLAILMFPGVERAFIYFQF